MYFQINGSFFKMRIDPSYLCWKRNWWLKYSTRLIGFHIALILFVTLCGYVRRADDLFVCFGAKPKQRAWARDLPRDRKWTRRGRSESQLTKEPKESSQQRRAEETSRREKAVQGKDGLQKEAMREDSQRLVGIPSGFCRSFAKNTRPR